MAGRLSSYRFRRRLLWSATLLGALAVGVTVSIVFWNTGPLKDETFSGGVAQTYVAPATVTLTAADKAEIVLIAKRFVSKAVTRDDPAAAFELAGPNMRSGTTKANWESGEIPVVPFPVDDARWRVDYSIEGEVGLEVYAWPEPNQGLRPTVFFMSLVAVERGNDRSWLVDSWVPRGGSPAVLAQRISGKSPFDPPEPTERYTESTSAAWLLVLPGAILGLLVAVPIVMVTRSRRIARRAARP